MARNEGFGGDPLVSGHEGGFSHLLDSGDHVVGLDMDGSFVYSSSSFPSLKPSTMLCFGNVECSSRSKKETTTSCRKSGITTGSDSASSASSSNNSCSSISITKSSKREQVGGEEKTEHERRRNGSGQGSDMVRLVSDSSIVTAAEKRRTSNKRPKKEQNPTISTPPPPPPTVRVRKEVRKEKLGERITALQQLVSPFGKTDTASVLHEAMGYIRFLHDQVQVLSSPYLQTLPSSAASNREGGGRRINREDDEVKGSTCVGDLRSRGLCLVPVEYTVHVGAECNGADLWSPTATAANNNMN